MNGCMVCDDALLPNGQPGYCEFCPSFSNHDHGDESRAAEQSVMQRVKHRVEKYLDLTPNADACVVVTQMVDNNGHLDYHAYGPFAGPEEAESYARQHCAIFTFVLPIERPEF